MSDVLDELKSMAAFTDETYGGEYVQHRAIAEIERLREQLRVRDNDVTNLYTVFREIADKRQKRIEELGLERDDAERRLDDWKETARKWYQRIEELEEELADRKEDLRNLAQASSASAINTMLQASAFRNQARGMRKRMAEDE